MGYQPRQTNRLSLAAAPVRDSKVAAKGLQLGADRGADASGECLESLVAQGPDFRSKRLLGPKCAEGAVLAVKCAASTWRQQTVMSASVSGVGCLVQPTQPTQPTQQTSVVIRWKRRMIGSLVGVKTLTPMRAT